jgi:hypothetical protein
MNPLDLVKVVIEYFKGQPFSNVIAFMQFIVISIAAYYGAMVLVPGERKAIDDMLQRTEAQHTKQIESITTAARENMTQVVTTFEKTLDRYDRRAAGGDGTKSKTTVSGRGDFD